MSMIPNFRFRLKTDARFGPGLSKELGKLIKEKSLSKPIVIIDKGVSQLPIANETLNNLKASCTVLSVFENAVAEPDYVYLDEVKAKFDGMNPDCVIGIGGGSTLDLAKGIATLLTNPGKGLQYRGFDLVKVPSLPIIAIPTTAGTGSEVTFNAVFTEKTEKRKLGINSEYNFPTLAVLDPEWLLKCPKKVAVSSGMDAIVHTLESFVASPATPTSKIYALAAFPLLFNNLVKAVQNPSDIESQSKVLLGSHYAGTSLFNSGAGPSGALSYPLGTHFNVPHGIAGAMFIPHVVRMNVERGCLAYNQFYDLIDGSQKGLDEKTKAVAFADAFQDFCNTLEVPRSLNGFGVRYEHKELFMKEATWLKGALGMNPIPFGEKEVSELLDRVIEK